MSVNKVILVGRLGADPESRATPSGVQVCNLRLATNHVQYDRDGNKNESTEWHRVVMFGRQAEVCEQYLRKGSQVYIEGRIRTNKYTDRDGIERYATEIIGERMQMLGGASIIDDTDNGGWGNRASGGTPSKAQGGGFGDNTSPMPGSGGQQNYSQAKPAPAPAPRDSGQSKGPDSFDGLDDDLPF